MKNFKISILACLLLFIFSCSQDTGKIKVTYSEAIAVYGDLATVRNTPLLSGPQEIINPGKIHVGDTYILVGDEGKGIHIIDNTNTTNPISTGFINIPGNREFIIADDHIYAESYYDVIKINIQNLEAPQLEGRAEFVFSEPIINDKNETLLGFDYTEVTKEVDHNSNLYEEISTHNTVYLDFAQNIIPQSALPSSFAGSSNDISGSVNRVAKYEDYIYIAARNDIHVIEDGSNFKLENTVKNAGVEMETIYPYKNKLFIGSRSSVDIFDISNPIQPLHDYSFDHATSCDPVLPYKEVAYVSLRTADFSDCPGNTNALIVLDITDLERPKDIKEINMKSPYGMTVINDKLYIGEGVNGLTIFDISIPTDPKRILTNNSIAAYDILPHPTDNQIILIAGPEGLLQYKYQGSSSMDLISRIDY